MQQNKLLYVDKKNRVTKLLAMFAKTDEEKYMYKKKTYGQFTEYSKPEIHENLIGDQGATEQDGYDTGKPKDEMDRKSTHLGKKKQGQDDNYITDR